MEFDPRRILEILAKHGVDYILVGGLAGALHGSPISTDDLDIVPLVKRANLDALATALNELNAKLAASDEPEGIKIDFTGKQLQKWIVEFRFLNLLTDYGRLDVIHRPGGTDGYQDLAQSSEKLDLGELQIRVAALEDIIRSKEAVGRARDLEHLPTLRMVLDRKNKRQTL